MFSSALTLIAIVFVGFLVAFFGAWKDTLWEQFSFKKFLRTPIVAVITGILLMSILGSPTGFWEGVGYVLSAVALERLLIDSFYKAIRRKMPSKFQQPQRDTGWFRERFSQILKRKKKAV